MVNEFIQWGFTVVKKVAFIVEGGTEKILLNSEPFSAWLTSLNLELVQPIVDATGGGNLLPHKIGDMIDTLKEKQPDHIFILTDLEHDPSILAVKTRLAHPEVHDCFVTILATESWFLACTEALSNWLNKTCYIDDPENRALPKPFERLKALGLEYKNRGCSNKKILAKQMLLHGFTFEKVLEHSNCTSMKYIERVFKSL